jgi:hypothetical protein
MENKFKFWSVIIGVTLLVATSFLGYKITDLRFDYDFEKFFPANDDDADYFYAHRKKLEADNNFLLIAVQREKGVFDRNFLNKVERFRTELSTIKYVKVVRALTNQEETFINSSGAACFASDLQVGGIYRDFAGEALLQTNTSCITLIGSAAAAAGRALNFLAGNNSRLCISTTGIATFTCQVCTPYVITNKLDVNGTLSPSLIAPYDTAYKTSNFLDFYPGNDNVLFFHAGTSWGDPLIAVNGTTAGSVLTNSLAQQLVIRGDGTNGIGFSNGSCINMIIKGSCVGIRTTSPRSTLHVQQSSNDGVPAVGCARDGLIISSNNSSSKNSSNCSYLILLEFV